MRPNRPFDDYGDYRADDRGRGAYGQPPREPPGQRFAYGPPRDDERYDGREREPYGRGRYEEYAEPPPRRRDDFARHQPPYDSRDFYRDERDRGFYGDHWDLRDYDRDHRGHYEQPRDYQREQPRDQWDEWEHGGGYSTHSQHRQPPPPPQRAAYPPERPAYDERERERPPVSSGGGSWMTHQPSREYRAGRTAPSASNSSHRPYSAHRSTHSFGYEQHRSTDPRGPYEQTDTRGDYDANFNSRSYGRASEWNDRPRHPSDGQHSSSHLHGRPDDSRGHSASFQPPPPSREPRRESRSQREDVEHFEQLSLKRKSAESPQAQPKHGRTEQEPVEERPPPDADANANERPPAAIVDGDEDVGHFDRGLSSLFELRFSEYGTKYYHFEVRIVKRSQHGVEKVLSNGGPREYRLQSGLLCTSIVQNIMRKETGYLYDGRANLFTTQSYEDMEPTEYPPEQLPADVRDFCPPRCVIVVSMKRREKFKLTPNDLLDVLRPPNEECDHSGRVFVDAVTTRALLQEPNHLHVGRGVYKQQVQEVGPGVVVREGIVKGLQVIANEDAPPTVFLTIDYKCSPFFSTKTMAEIYDGMVRKDPQRGREKFVAFMRDVRFKLSYDARRTYVFSGLTPQPLSSYSCRGQSVAGFLAAKYHIQVRREDRPAVLIRTPQGNESIYPLEFCSPVDGQKISLTKMPSDCQQAVLQKGALSAPVRYQKILDYVGKLTHPQSPGGQYLEAFNIRVDGSSNDVALRRHPLPQLLAGNRQVNVQANGDWLTDCTKVRFVEPAVKQRWVVAYDERIGQQGINYTLKTFFGERICRLAHEQGFNLDRDLLLQKFQPVSLAQLAGFVRWAAEKQYDGMFYVCDTDRRNRSTHGALKLFEAVEKTIVTQHIRLQTINKSGMSTMWNIVAKANAKVGGLSVVPRIEESLEAFAPTSPDVLVIGYDVCHPPPASNQERGELARQKQKDVTHVHPSVVGVTMNKSANNWTITGTYFFQQSRREAVDPAQLEDTIKRMVEERMKNNQSIPKKVIVLRDGVSDGQWNMAVGPELDAIASGIKAGLKDPNAQFKVLFAVVTKRHHNRFFFNDSGRIQDGGADRIEPTLPGHAVDRKVVVNDKNARQFFMQGHHPIGKSRTPKIPEYTILKDEFGLSLLQIQQLLLPFCSVHQIVALNISLPAPIFQADELAKRGYDNYSTWRGLPDDVLRENPRLAQIPFYEGPSKDPFDFRAMTAALNDVFNPIGSALATTRFNA